MTLVDELETMNALLRRRLERRRLERAQSREGVLHSVLSMTDEERMELLSHFCTHCGTTHLPCYCWNDE